MGDRETGKPESVLRRGRIRWVSTGIVLAIMIAIFLFSSQAQEESEGLSFPIGDAAIESGVFETKVFSGIRKAKQSPEELWLFVQRLVRKLAHAVIFMALGGSMLVCWESWLGKRRLNGLWSALCGIAYAASDEWHQTMVPGRSGSMEDVLIDAAGVVIGVLAAMGIVRLVQKRAMKKQGSE